MAYLKPQSPIKNGEDYIYPLTTHDQVILSNGNRWSGSTAVADLDPLAGAQEGSIITTDANGKLVSSSVNISELAPDTTYSLSGTTLSITTIGTNATYTLSDGLLMITTN